MDAKLTRQLDHLDASLRTLLEQLKDYTDQELNRKPKPEAWSTLQVMHHLMLAEKQSISYVQKKINYTPDLKKAGISSFFKGLLLKSYLAVPIKIKAPEVVSTEKLPVESKFWETAKNWKKQRSEMRDYLNSLSTDTLKKEAYKHPAGGRMGIKQMLDFQQAHFNRHRKQIKKMLY